MGFRDLFKRPPKVEGGIGFFQLTDWWLTTFSPEERKVVEERYHPLGVSNPRPLTQGKIYSSTQSPAGLLWGLASWFRSPSNRSIQQRILAKARELAEAGQNPIDIHFTYQGLIQSFYKDRDADPTALDVAIEVCLAQIEIAPQVVKAFKREHERPKEGPTYRDLGIDVDEPPDQDTWLSSLPEEKQREYLGARYEDWKSGKFRFNAPRPFQLPRHVGFEQLAIIREKQQNYADAIRVSQLAMKQGWAGDWESRLARCEKKLAKKSPKRTKHADLLPAPPRMKMGKRLAIEFGYSLVPRAR